MAVIISCSTMISMGQRQYVLYLCTQLTQFIVKTDLSYTLFLSWLSCFFYFRTVFHDVRISGQEQYKFQNEFAFFGLRYLRFFELNSIKSIEFVEYHFQWFLLSELLNIMFYKIYRIWRILFSVISMFKMTKNSIIQIL